MPRVSRSPQRDRVGGGGGGRETRCSDTADQSSLGQSCCRETRRCGRSIEEPYSSSSSSRHQEGRSGGRCHVRRQRERREELRERARREALVEETEENVKRSTRSRVCRWANIAMGVVIALGLIFVFYVITTIIIDGSSPLDSLFGHKDPADPNLRNFTSSSNGTSGINDEIQIKSTVEPKEVVTFSTPRFTSTMFPVTILAGKDVINMNKTSEIEFPKNANSSIGDGQSFTDVPDIQENEDVDDYYYEDQDENSNTKSRTKTHNNKEDNDWEESIMDTSLNHDIILNDSHQMPIGKNSLSAQIIVNRKGLPPSHRSKNPHSIHLHNLQRSVDLTHDPIPSYSRSDQPNPYRNVASRRNMYLTDYNENTEDDETSNHNVNRRRNGNIPYIHSPRNAYSDVGLERYNLRSKQTQEDGSRLRNRDYLSSYVDRDYTSPPRDRRYESRYRDREAILHQRPIYQRSDFVTPSVSKRFRVRKREPYHQDSYYSPDSETFPREEHSYGRSLFSTPSSTSDVELRKLSDHEKSQILELDRIKRQRSMDSNIRFHKSHSTPVEYKYPSSATSIRDIIDYMNRRDGKYDAMSRKVSNSEEIFRDIRMTPPSSGFVIGDQEHVIGNNVFKPFNKFAVDAPNYNNIPFDETLPIFHPSNKDHFNLNINNGDIRNSKVPGSYYNNNYKNSNKNANSYSNNNNDHRLPLEDAYPSRPRPEQDDHLYSVGTSIPKVNKVYPTSEDPYVGSSSSSRSKTNPFSLTLDIYPSEDMSDPNAEMKTHLSLSEEFQDEYERMMRDGEAGFRSSEPTPLNRNKNEIILHVNLYSKPLHRPTHPFRPSNRQEDVSLEFPLTGTLAPSDIYRAIVQQKRLWPVASAQMGNYSEHKSEQLLVDSDMGLLAAERNSKLYAAIEKVFNGLEPYLPEDSKTININTPPKTNK